MKKSLRVQFIDDQIEAIKVELHRTRKLLRGRRARRARKARTRREKGQ